MKLTMNGCTEISKPLIAILLATYEPNMEWLRQQLESLNQQTYQNIKLYVRDDCSPTVSWEDIQEIVAECITAFEYEVSRSPMNLGSNKTFEWLTQHGQGDYYAYCDQDDVWFADKLEILERSMNKPGVTLACSDMCIIDGQGNQLADSITKVRKRHVFHQGNGLVERLVISNFVTGCTMLLPSQIAESGVPFEDTLVHDHWLAIVAALAGEIVVVEQPLISYRQHGNNQTGVLSGVEDKESYYNKRIVHYEQQNLSLRKRLRTCEATTGTLEQYGVWIQARKAYYKKPRIRNLKTMWHYRKFGPQTVLLETVVSLVPSPIFKWIIRLAKRGIL